MDETSNIDYFLDISFDIVIWIFFTIYFVFIFNYVLSTIRFYRKKKKQDLMSYQSLLEIEHLPEITFILPAYNEETSIIQVVNNVLGLSYPNKKVIVVVNGSEDATIDRLRNEFDLVSFPTEITQRIKTKEIKSYFKSKNFPNFSVVEKEDKSKSDAQNVALNLCKSPYVVCMDADTYLKDDEFTQMVLYFLSMSSCIAMGSSVGVVNNCTFTNSQITHYNFPKKYLEGLQQIDYDLTVVGYRFGGVFNGSNLIVPGAFGVFNYKRIMQVNGFSEDTLLDDVDLSISLQMNKYKKGQLGDIETSPFSVCYTQVPRNVKELVIQRERWEREGLWIFAKYKKMFFSGKYGNIGTFGLPYYAMQSCYLTLIQLYVLMLIPIALYTNYYDWTRVLFFVFIGIGLRFSETVHIVYVKNITLNKFMSFKDLSRIYRCALGYIFTMDVLLFISRLKGVYKFFTKSRTWKQVERIKVEPYSKE